MSFLQKIFGKFKKEEEVNEEFEDLSQTPMEEAPEESAEYIEGTESHFIETHSDIKEAKDNIAKDTESKESDLSIFS